MDTVKPTVVRLSLRWVFAAVLAVLTLGVIGGIIGVSVYGPQAPLQLPGNQLVTNVQEVTVSPSRVVSELVAGSERSVLHLAYGTRANPRLLSIATVVTNDGVLATHHAPVQGEVFAIDSTGSFLSLESLGRDDVYGITFYRVRDGVLPPLELHEDNPNVGTSLFLLARSPQTNMPTARVYHLEQYAIRQEADPHAWQRIGVLDPALTAQPGTPLLTEEGKVAALVIDPDTSRVLPISYLQRSLDRLSTGQREYNPFEIYGFEVNAAISEPNEQHAFALVFTITSVQRDIAPTLRVGDTLVAINDQKLTFSTDIVALLSDTPPLTLTISRNEREQTVSIPATLPSS